MTGFLVGQYFFILFCNDSDSLRYTGHIHQLRYRHGHTYGEETHRLAHDFPELKRSTTDLTPMKIDQSDPYETREFADGMLPGYTGLFVLLRIIE